MFAPAAVASVTDDDGFAGSVAYAVDVVGAPPHAAAAAVVVVALQRTGVLVAMSSD